MLNAHPDLAGKLAAAKRLTPESAREQASAGLDALTDKERELFSKLNAAYVTTFGFPFIIAVKGKTKDEILAAFETRIGNDRATRIRHRLQTGGAHRRSASRTCFRIDLASAMLLKGEGGYMKMAGRTYYAPHGGHAAADASC